MLILHILLLIVYQHTSLVFPFYLIRNQDDISVASNSSQVTTNKHMIMKRKVPLKDELEFYKEVNEIKPEILEVLMPNMTGEAYVRTPPSNRCCYNGGTCFVPTNNRADRYCKCPPNFKGRYCAEDVDECLLPQTCGDHELCTNTYGSFSCSCEHGYIREGVDCIRKVSCYEDPCLNFSQCVDLEEGKTLCLCRPGFKGMKCEMRISECDDSSCNENESCIVTIDGFLCVKM